jgi:hypothetical protein
MSSIPPLKDALALIVDGSSSPRHAMELALKHLGVTKRVGLARVADTHSVVAQRAFDIIFCDLQL